MNRIALFVPLAIFLVLAVFFWRGLSLDPNAMPSALLDKPFPEFALPKLEDESQILTRDNIVGQVSLVNVWGSWCVACKYEHPVLNQLAERGIPIIGVSYKDDAKPANQWLDELGNPYVFNIVDREGVLGINLGVFGAPETYVVDQQGIIRYKHVGIVNLEVWDKTLKPLFDQYSQ